MAERSDQNMRRRNDRLVALCLGGVVAMVGLTYAAVPLYKIFCQATGFKGTTQVGTTAPGAVEGMTFAIHFDANVANGLSWRFKPEQRTVTVKAGEQELAFYRAENRGRVPVTGQAVFNVTPDVAGQYFTKIDCFCFTEQTLGPGEAIDMPVTFYLDPAILADPDLRNVRDITLSYTFYPAAPASPLKTDTVQVGLHDADTGLSAN